MTLTNTKVRNALQGSIEKWRKIVDGTGVDRGEIDCQLCKLFLTDGLDCCIGCPIQVKTRMRFCLGTPYINWQELHSIYKAVKKAETKVQINAAKKMLEFLEKLDREFFVKGVSNG